MGCSSTSFMSKTNQVYPEKNPMDVEIFFTQIPERPYQEIGLVHIDKYPPFSPIPYTTNKIKEMIKVSAAKNGGDAVINMRDEMSQVSGTVIVYRN